MRGGAIGLPWSDLDSVGLLLSPAGFNLILP